MIMMAKYMFLNCCLLLLLIFVVIVALQIAVKVVSAAVAC